MRLTNAKGINVEEVEEINSVQEEIATPETENHEPIVEAPKVETKPVEDRQERNWKAIRERQKDLEKELKLQKELNERLLQMSQPAPKTEVDELDQIGDEEFIPKGKVKRLVEKQASQIALEIAKKEAEKLIQQQQQSQFLDRLKRQYQDFDEIVNSETLSLLEEQDPELAETIADLKDPYKIGMQSYKYIKALKLADKAPEARRAKEVDKKLEKNAKTVPSPAAYDKRPLAKAYQMTEAEKNNLYKEMYHAASQAGFSY
jgi:hypothetical protein